MCEATTPRGPGARRGPRWRRLYAGTAVLVAALAAVEAVVPAGPERAIARGIAWAATFVAMATWVRLNRVALDQEGWCECASARLRVRVIASRRSLAGPAPYRAPAPEAIREGEEERVPAGVE